MKKDDKHKLTLEILKLSRAKKVLFDRLLRDLDTQNKIITMLQVSQQVQYDETGLCELILENKHLLTCFNCGETLESKTTHANDTAVAVLHIDPGGIRYPREQDIPASAYFECMKCYRGEKA